MFEQTKKTRIPIPKDIEAKVMFNHDRTCCVCNEKMLRIEIHHIDENPSNNSEDNLAVLCAECHGFTFI